MTATIMVLALFVCQEQDVDRLVRRLGDEDVQKRLEAKEKLLGLGESARAAVRKATESADLEKRRLAREILQTLDLARELRTWMGPATRITLSGRMTLEDAVRRIERQCGQKVTAESWPSGSFDVDLRDVPYWQALERLCEASGKRTLRPTPEGPQLIGERAARNPSVLSGPFRISADRTLETREFRMSTNTEEKAFILDLTVSWERSIAPVRSYLALEKVVDDGGRDLTRGFHDYEKRISPGYYPAFLKQDRVYVKKFRPITASPPDEAAKTLSRVEGTITLYIRASQDDLTLALPKDGEVSRAALTMLDESLKHSEEGMILLSNMVRRETVASCRLSFENMDRRIARDVFNHLYLSDREGKRYQGRSTRVPRGDGTLGFGLAFMGVSRKAELTGITIRLPRRMLRVEIPFVLRDVPIR